MWLQKYQKLKLLVFSYHEVWNLILQDTTPNKILSLKTEKLSSLWSKNKNSSKNMKMEQHKNWKNQPHRRFSAFIFRICKYFEKLDHLIIVRNLTEKASECGFCVHKSLCVVWNTKKLFQPYSLLTLYYYSRSNDGRPFLSWTFLC